MVADSTKWSVVGVSTFAGLDRADVLVTDEGLSKPAREVFSQHVGDLLLAPLVTGSGEDPVDSHPSVVHHLS